MAVYFEPQRKDESFLGGLSQGLQPMLRYMMDNQMMQNRNDLNQENMGITEQMNIGRMNLQNEMNEQNYQNRLNEEREYKQKQSNKMFGTTMQNAGRDNQGSIKIEGQMNPQNTGLSQQTLNRTKMGIDTGVNPMNYQQKQPKQQRPQYDYKGGVRYKDGEKIGDYPLTPREKGETGKGTSPKQKRLVKLQSNINAMNQKKTSIMAGENIYDSVTGAKEKALGNLEGDMLEAIYELKTSYPDDYMQMYPEVKIRTGVDKKTGRKVIQFPDGTIKYVN